MRLFCVRLLALCAAIAVGTIGAAGAAWAADINVILDRAQLVKLPDRAASVVIGNPAVADASVQTGGWMILTAKGYGTTNLIALDRTGAVLMEKTVEVQPPQDVVVVYKGVDRETYSCTPECSRQLTLGDSVASFGATAGQITARNSLAAGSVQTR
jgi:hypothetical protein